jgi:membrane-bound lytic murein transglycosylase B
MRFETRSILAFTIVHMRRGTAVAQWLRYCATNQKVAGLIPDGVMKLFIDINPSDRTMALGSTQPLTDMSTRSISWG